MAFPFDFMDLFIPEIANWMAGKNASDKQRFRRAGTGLILLGLSMVLVCYLFEAMMVWAFNSLAWALLLSFLLVVSGLFLLFCYWVDSKRDDTMD
jgi:hypothetical protein